MHIYKVHVVRDDRWWMITVPELHGYVTRDGSTNLSDTTQARRLSEVPSQARDFICTVTDVAPSKVSVDITVSVDDIDVTAAAEKVNRDRELAERHMAAAQGEARDLARKLAARGVPVRDVGEVLGVSFQRAQQLITA
ncbi:hypothetical protein MCHIJ_33510 [Mycolicibacterium chitae]|uniref:Conserved protein of uncharacterized function putative phage protein n=1 Tax=Mycolicibacterium chitae TaxID=1792 RepID=A0A448I5B1_MYCCI|nr:HicB family toxin-antitoxin system [Mycolicibacterium chitae]MCV7106911.1 HicB family toxin-antitoxin system [Mycolicibacterium chitae]BBZ03914.1 hypothetical protein MCHIJ_33510 [Mycolicibacterium chitae]VEG47565.1 Conserved protein of uncharacterised function; putative phage protein [Mycolicibacterium chitae]